MASKAKQIAFAVVAGTAFAVILQTTVFSAGGITKDAWCAYKLEKDVLSAEANKNPDFMPPERGADAGWTERRAAWIEPKIAELQVKHFGSEATAKQAVALQAKEQWNCRK